MATVYEYISQQLKRYNDFIKTKFADKESVKKVSDTIGDISSLGSIDTMSLASIISAYGVRVENFGAKGDGKTDDSLAIQAAIDYSKSKRNNVVLFPTGTFICHDLIGYEGLILKGVNRTKNDEFSTILTRTKDTNIITFKGGSVVNSQSHLNDFIIENIKIKTGDVFEAPAVELTCVSNFRINNCLFFGKGKQLLIWEGFDSRINNTDFEWGGTDDGGAGVEVRSTNGGNPLNPTYEFSNQIYFDNCRFESYVGEAIITTGENTNELNFSNVKFESINNTNSHFYLNGCTSLNFNYCQLCLSGKERTSPFKMNKVVNSHIDLNIEIASYGNKLESSVIHIGDGCYKNILEFRILHLSDSVYDSTNPLVSTSMNSTDFNNNDMKVTVSECTLTEYTLFQYKKQTYIDDLLTIIGQKIASGIQFKRTDIPGFWELGRIDSSGFKMLLHDGSKESQIFSVNGNKEMFFPQIMHFNNGVHFYRSDKAPWTPGYGCMYVDKTNNDAWAQSMGSNWMYETSASSVPTEGTWKKNTKVWNSNPSAGSCIGWICVQAGTFGSDTEPIFKEFGAIES